MKLTKSSEMDYQETLKAIKSLIEVYEIATGKKNVTMKHIVDDAEGQIFYDEFPSGVFG